MKKMLKTAVFVAIFGGAYLFALGSGRRPLASFLVGIGALVVSIYLKFLLAPFFSSFSAFLWFKVSLASFFLLGVGAFSQLNRALAWNEQTTGFYLTAGLLGLVTAYFLFYTLIILRVFLSAAVYFFRDLSKRILKRSEK